MTTSPVTDIANHAGRLRQRCLSTALLISSLAGLGAIAMPNPAQAEAQSRVTSAVAQAEPATQPEAVAQPVAPTTDALTVDLPEEIDDLREMGQEIDDRLSEIDPAIIQQVMRPLGRQALQIFLDSAPGLSQKAIELGEQGLAELEKRAAERLEQAQREFEQNEFLPQDP